MTEKSNIPVEPGPGFTLLEVMVAMAVIAIALTAVFQLQSLGITMACEARFNTTGPLLAQKKMAEIEMLKPEDVVPGSGKFEDFPEYAWKLEVEPVELGMGEEVSDYLKRLSLTVSWGEDDFYTCNLGMYVFAPER